MTDRPLDDTSKRPIRALYRWLKGASSAPEPEKTRTTDPGGDALPARLGHYAVVRKLATTSVVLSGGRVAWTGAASELLDDGDLTKSLLGVGH